MKTQRPQPGETWRVDLDKVVKVQITDQVYALDRSWVIFETLQATRQHPAGSVIALPAPGTRQAGADQWKGIVGSPIAPPRQVAPPVPAAAPKIKRPRKPKRPRDRAEELRAQGVPITRSPSPAEQIAFAREFPEYARPMPGPAPPVLTPPPPVFQQQVAEGEPQRGEVWLVSEQGVTWPGVVVGFDPATGPYGGVVELRALRGDPPQPVGEVMTALRTQLVQRLA